MKLIIKEYLASLRERGELDAILPDLLSQMGMNVYSRPGRGTRQDGVDVAAVGNLDGKGEKVYLFSIKAGDLTRKDWDGASEQSLRPSLNEIIDAYIPNSLPIEHREKDIVICITLGGEIQEQVRRQLKGFLSQNAPDNVTFEEWNGDKIAEYLLQYLMKEDLLPETARSYFRKSLAMLDEPEVSYRHYTALLSFLVGEKPANDKKRLVAIRQIAICLWILFAWSRTAGNLESAYRASEVSLLYAWELLKGFAGKKSKAARSMNTAFMSIFTAHQTVVSEYLKSNILPYVDITDGLATAVHGSTSLDVNLKLFDVLGRIATDGLWAYWGASRCSDDEVNEREAMLAEASARAKALRQLISNNTILLLPARDDHAIDVFLAILLLATELENADFVRSWLDHMMDRARFTYESNGNYPSVLRSYPELLAHPKSTDSDYRESATAGSILYPFVAFWAAIINDIEVYEKVSGMKQECLPHCTFQIWYPDESSEDAFYTNKGSHGAVLTDIDLSIEMSQFLERVFVECEKSPECMELTAVKYNWWPIILVACRHYRLPPPLHLAKGLWQREDATENSDDEID